MPIPHITHATPLTDLTLAFLDVETTGLDAYRGDRICEIAIVRSFRDTVETSYQTLVNPGRRISRDASAVNHIRDADVRDAPRFSEVAETVRELLESAVVVCHNAPFDLSFVTNEMQLAGRSLDLPWVVDTLTLARRWYSFGSNSLPNVARALGIRTPHAHRAMGDALTAREVYRCFTRDLWNRGVRTLGELLRAQGGSAFTPGVTQETLPPEIDEALKSGRRLFLSYIDGSGRVTERWVTPREVSRTGGIVALVAYCHLRNEERNFRLDRIIAIRVEG